MTVGARGTFYEKFDYYVGPAPKTRAKCEKYGYYARRRNRAKFVKNYRHKKIYVSKFVHERGTHFHKKLTTRRKLR